MVKNRKVLEAFEREQIRRERLSYPEKLKLMDALWQEGMALGVLPPKDPLEGIEADIRIARILNRCSRKPSSK
jgi:hypothetical protein